MQDESNSNRTKAESRKRRLTFRFMAVLLGILPFGLLETSLRIAGVAKPTQIDDPFVGFSGIHPLFEQDEKAHVYRTAISRQRAFAEEEFAATKPKNGFRVFCLGGSTVHGRPYQPDTAFSKWMQLELAAMHPDREVEVVNCGGISYASYRLLPILREVLGYDPDLIVIATGHNEFLEDRTYESIKNRSGFTTMLSDFVYSFRTITLFRGLFSSDSKSQANPSSETELLPEEVKTRLDDQSGYASYHYDDKWRSDVLTHFQSTIRTMTQLCRDADVPVILIQLGCNLRDCPPFKSEHPPDFSKEQEWQALFDQARAAETDDLERALDLYRQAEQIQSKHSLLAYRMGRCFDLLDQTDKSREYYLKARQWDVCPLRAIEETLDAIPQAVLANDANIAVLDARRLIEQLSSDGIPGFDWYIDHVHPTIRAHQQIGRRLVEEVTKMRLLGDAKEVSVVQRREIYEVQMKELGPTYIRNGGRRVGWLEHWARRQRLLGESKPRDAKGFERLGARHLDLGDYESAWEQFATAIGLDTDSVRRLADHADKLAKQGRAEAAERLIEWLPK